MASASASPTPFTFASPISSSSETHDEDANDFDYESWIQQSKMANCYSNNHQEMMLPVSDNLPEEAYELSLRDIAELSLHSPPPPRPTPPTTTMSTVHRRHKSSSSISMEAAGSFIIKLFKPSPSRAAAGSGRRNKSFSSSLKAGSALRKRSASANHGRSRSMENGIQSNGYHDSTKRNPVSCYPFFNSRKYKAKHKFTGNQ